MLHVIWIILKIIGIALLALLSVILAAVLLVLLCPVRYRADGSYRGGFKGKARITWLCRAVSARVFCEEGDVSFAVRILGFRLGDSKKKVEKEELKNDFFDETGESIEEEEELVHATSIPSVNEESPGAMAVEPDLRRGEYVDGPVRDDGRFTEKRERSGAKESAQENEADNTIGGRGDRNKGLLTRIRERAVKFLDRLRLGFRRTLNILTDLTKKKELLRNFLRDEENKRTGRLIVRQVKALCRHVFSKKGTGTFTFGFEDPYRTGQVLCAVSLIYPFCHKRFQFHPVFDRVVLEGDFSVRGRVRVGTVIAILLRVWMDRNFRRLLKRWRAKIKEE